MTGAVLGAMAAAAQNAAGGGGSGGSGVAVPSPAPVWTSIFGTDVAYTNSQTIAAITVPITLTLGNSGTAALLYSLNGLADYYTGGFSVHAGDILSFGVAVGNSALSGAITVTNVSDASAILALIPYVVRSSGGGGGKGVLP